MGPAFVERFEVRVDGKVMPDGDVWKLGTALAPLGLNAGVLDHSRASPERFI